MTNNEKYEYMFFMGIYIKLGLKNYEEILEKQGIKEYEGEVNNEQLKFSKYFSFLNEGTTENFSEAEQIRFKKYFTLEIFQILSDPNLKKEVLSFVESTAQKYFFTEKESKYKYYGPATMEYMAPTDAIVFGIDYNKFNLKEKGNTEEKIEKNEQIISDVINEIQFNLAPQHNMKIAVIKRNEFAISQQYTKI